MRRAAALAVLMALTGCGDRAPLPALHGVASIDFCADQMVLGLLPKDRVRAVSFEADSDASFAVPRAKGLARLRPQLEDIVALRPAVVVRSYGGDGRLDRQLARMGIKVVQLGFPASLADARTDVLRVGGELGADARARALVTGLDRELTAADAEGAKGSALYVTPGDVTTGPGSLVAEVMGAAGYTPYRAAPGWGSLPVEDMVRRPPDLVFRAFFDSPRYRQDYWTASRHPVVARATRGARDVEVPGAWLACGNWLMGHAVTELASAR
jgi:iron complex transport system substrate-binding protein